MAKTKALARPPRYRFQYAAKFLCTSNIPGTSQTTSALLPGVYQTAVNIHNPQPRTVELRKKLALAGGPISKFINQKLEPDAATRVDCGDVGSFELHLIHGFEGFLVIESTESLDVVAGTRRDRAAPTSPASTWSTCRSGNLRCGPPLPREA
jgi:hypothetical protein